MKKHSLALAVASLAVAAPAMAQNVTLFGVLDAAVVSINKVPTAAGSTSNVGMPSNLISATSLPPGAHASNAAVDRVTAMVDGAVTSARWGMRGTEDLGGGLSALFYLEGDANMQGYSHASGLFRRGSYVGLSSKSMGELTIGNRVNPLIAANGALMPVSGNGVSTLTSGALGFSDFYTRNAINYTSPTIGGLVIVGQHGFSQDASSSNEGSVSAANATFTAGDLTVRAAYQNRRGTVASNALSGSNAGSTAGVVVDKVTTLFGLSYKVNNAITVAVAGFKNEVSNPTTKASVYDLQGQQYGIGWQATPAVLLGLNATTAEGATMTNVQARYALSKRTTGYVQVINADNGSKVAFSPTSMSSHTTFQIDGCTGGSCAVTNVRQTSMAVGVMHSF